MHLLIHLTAYNSPEFRIIINGVEMPIPLNLEDIEYDIGEGQQTIRIEHFNKCESDTIIAADGNETRILQDKALELKSMQFDDYKISDMILYNIPFLVHPFVDVDRKLPKYVENTLFFGYNGVYEIRFDNFYEWYFEQMCLAEEKAHQRDDKLMKYDAIVDVNDNAMLSIQELSEIIEMKGNKLNEN